MRMCVWFCLLLPLNAHECVFVAIPSNYYSIHFNWLKRFRIWTMFWFVINTKHSQRVPVSPFLLPLFCVSLLPFHFFSSAHTIFDSIWFNVFNTLWDRLTASEIINRLIDCNCLPYHNQEREKKRHTINTNTFNPVLRSSALVLGGFSQFNTVTKVFQLAVLHQQCSKKIWNLIGLNWYSRAFLTSS